MTTGTLRGYREGYSMGWVVFWVVLFNVLLAHEVVEFANDTVG